MVLKYDVPQVVRACANCQFYLKGALDQGSGECRIGRPFLSTNGSRRVWPVVFNEDWCGEFRPRTDDSELEQRLLEVAPGKQRVDS